MIKILLNTFNDSIEKSNPWELELGLNTPFEEGSLSVKGGYISGVYDSPEGKLKRVWIDLDDEDQTSFHFVVYSDSWSVELCEYFVRYILEVSNESADFHYNYSSDVGIHWDSTLQEFTGYSS